MTSEEWDRIVYQQFMNSVTGILNDSVDISKACSVVHNTIWTTDEFLKQIDEKKALYLKGIWSELIEFPKDEKRLSYTQEELRIFDEKEKK